MSRGLLPKLSVGVAALAITSAVAYAELKPWTDYTISDAVTYVTTIKIEPNMKDVYLEGLKQTWVAANEVSKRLGQIEDYRIYASTHPQSGDFNLMTVVRYKNTAAIAPSKERYDAFMKEWGEARNKQTIEYSQKNYPAVRKITGDYVLREITLK